MVSSGGLSRLSIVSQSSGWKSLGCFSLLHLVSMQARTFASLGRYFELCTKTQNNNCGTGICRFRSLSHRQWLLLSDTRACQVPLRRKCLYLLCAEHSPGYTKLVDFIHVSSVNTACTAGTGQQVSWNSQHNSCSFLQECSCTTFENKLSVVRESIPIAACGFDDKVRTARSHCVS